ncbi:MAG TPA: nucleotidyltransferase domain-containing protein [Bacteroidota bacterium]|nr:nucleotidyltransferase domain-containing protein [Bacteroidota bacterium]
MDVSYIIKEVFRIIRRYLSDEYKVFVFGSWATGSALPTSDVDIGILGNQPVPWEIMHRIRGEVEAIPTLRRIDVVDLYAKEPTFTENILRTAILVENERDIQIAQ